MRPVVWALSLAMVATAGSRAQGGDAPEQYDLDGTLGPYRIGMSLIVQPDHHSVTGGHYFYVTKLTDIPLTPQDGGPEPVNLHEPGGGDFHLHFLSNGSAKPPFDFYTATRLEGVWTQGARTLPVKLGFESSEAVPRPGHRYTVFTTAPDSQVEANARRFLQGVIHGDKAEATSAVSYPLEVYPASGPHYRIANRQGLLARWNSIFTPGYVALLKTAVPHDMFSNYRGAMVCSGAAWFDDKGASSLNVRS